MKMMGGITGSIIIFTFLLSVHGFDLNPYNKNKYKNKNLIFDRSNISWNRLFVSTSSSLLQGFSFQSKTTTTQVSAYPTSSSDDEITSTTSNDYFCSNNSDGDIKTTTSCERNNNKQYHVATTRRGFFSNLIRQSALVVSSVTILSKQNNANAEPAALLEAPPPAIVQSLPITLPQQQTNRPPIDLIQFETAGMIPRIYFEEKRSIYGFVERVLDGDTIRITHVPNYIYDSIIPQPIQKRGISDITIAVRFYGIDAPETAKNKNQTSMPFGDDAKAFTASEVYHKMVKVTLLQKDKYGRVVAAVETVPTTITSPSKDLSVELAKRGLAELYTGGGAQYWTKKDQLVAAVTDAQKNKRGIWSLGDAFVSAAEQKRINRGES